MNFSGTDSDVDINIPRHAFDHLGIAEGDYRACELLSGRKMTKAVTSELPFITHLPAHGAVVWKFVGR